MKMMAVSYLRLQVAQQRQHLRLGGDVDRRRRLVGDQQARLAAQRHGDHGALAQAARELPGIGVDPLLRHRDADVAEQADRDVARLGPRELAAVVLPAMTVQQDRLDDLVADRVHRAEGGHRLLRDQRDLARRGCRASPAPRGGSLREIDRLRAVAPAEADLARGDAAGPFDQLQDRLHGHALAAAAFADDAEHLAGHDVEAGAVDGAHQPLVHREGDAEVADREQRGRTSFIGASVAVRVGGIAQPVADEVEGQHRDDDDQAGDQQPRRQRQGLDVLRLLQQHAPADRRRPDAEAEEATATSR